MQGFCFESNLRCDYKPTFWILCVVIYLLQVEIITGISPQPLPNLPDSDAIIINSNSSTGNETSPLRIEKPLSNVDAHIADFVPKVLLPPKKVQSGTDSTGKQSVKEKPTVPTRSSPKVNNTATSDEQMIPPKHFPEGADLSPPHKAGPISKTAEKLLLNPKEENPPKSTEIQTTPSSATETEFPPKILPKGNISFNNGTIPLIVNHNGANFTNIPAVFPTDNSTGPVYDVNKTSEAFDMTHSKKYYGQFDLDDEKHIAEKMNKTKTENPIKSDPKSQVDVSPTLDKNGPKSMPANKNGGITGVLSSTSNVVAISSAVLSSKPSKNESMLQPIKAIAATVMTIIGMTILGMAGFLLWRRIIQRRFGHREMLINEDDFEEVSDLHHFEGTTPSTPNLIA